MAEDRILLVTVNKNETKAVLEALKVATGADPDSLDIEGRVYRDLGSIGPTRIFHALTEMGSASVGGSLQTVDKAIRALKPTIVIAVGIAFGVNEEKQGIGQILVSRQLLLYELQRVGLVTVSRGDKPHASPRLINLFDGVAQSSWQGAEVHFGTLLSGEKLIDNLDYRGELIKLESEALGGEMEGGGIYVACQEHKVDWIVIKSICDWADGTKGKNKTARQQKAAASAAAFVTHALLAVFLRGAPSQGREHEAGDAEAQVVVSPRALELLEQFSVALSEYRQLFANYSSYILNKVSRVPDHFEPRRLELDKSMVDALSKLEIYLPKHLRVVAGRLRRIVSCSWQPPLDLYYELFHARNKFPRDPVDAAHRMLNDLADCFLEMSFEFAQGRYSSTSYLRIQQQHSLDADANPIGASSPTGHAARAVILEHEYLRADRSEALLGYGAA